VQVAGTAPKDPRQLHLTATGVRLAAFAHKGLQLPRHARWVATVPLMAFLLQAGYAQWVIFAQAGLLQPPLLVGMEATSAPLVTTARLVVLQPHPVPQGRFRVLLEMWLSRTV
jgi:hypothetical protein